MTATSNTTETTASNSKAPNASVTPAHSITTIESLTREARRRGFRVHGGFHPPDLIPMVEAAIAEHNKRERGFNELSGDYIEWKQTMDNLQEFLAFLRALPAKLPHDKKAEPAPAPNTGETVRQKIERLQKEIDAKVANLPPALQQQLKGVPHPSDEASDTRPNPVPDASQDASRPSQDAPKTPPPATPSDRDFLLLREDPSRSPIDDFTPERQRILYGLIQEFSFAKVARMIGQPEPIGWNFKTSDTSIKRFKKRYDKKLKADERAAALADAHETIQQTGADEETYMTAARRLLKMRFYKNAADPEGKAEELELLMSLLDRQRRTDLAERRVQVAEKKATQ